MDPRRVSARVNGGLSGWAMEGSKKKLKIKHNE